MKNPFSSLAAPLLLLLAAASAQAQTASPDSQAKVAMCIGCHGIPGYQASFPEIYKVPKISGQNEKFIAAALQAYRKGERKHPTMRGIAQSLTDQDIAEISAFYAKHGGAAEAPPEVPAVQPSTEVAALLQKGGCAACHGANFNKPIDGSYPKVAGQHADYLFFALKAYRTEGNPNVGRANAIMAAQVKQFNPDQLKQIAQYLGSLPGELKTVRQPPFK
jgi:cytochrome c553